MIVQYGFLGLIFFSFFLAKFDNSCFFGGTVSSTFFFFVERNIN